MVHHLADGPTFGSVRCLELLFRKAPYSLPKLRRSISDLVNKRSALSIGNLSDGLERAHGIMQITHWGVSSLWFVGQKG
jgi:hypothetical protein